MSGAISPPVSTSGRPATAPDQDAGLVASLRGLDRDGRLLFVTRTLRLFGYGSFFRNGPMPNIGVFPLKVDQEKGVAAGYGLGAGAEWRFNRNVAVQASYDRYVDGIYPDSSTRGAFGLVLFKVASF